MQLKSGRSLLGGGLFRWLCTWSELPQLSQRKKKKKKHNMSGDSTGAKSAGHLTLVIALMDGLGWISCSAYALLSFSVKFM